MQAADHGELVQDFPDTLVVTPRARSEKHVSSTFA